MPLVRIEIEQIERDRWVAEVEAGYPSCRRERVTAGDLVGIVTRVGEAYERLMGRPQSVAERVLSDPLAPTSAVVAAYGPVPTSFLAPPPSLPPSPEPSAWSGTYKRASPALLAKARAIGIRAKGQWSEARVLREVRAIAGDDAA